MKLTDIQHIFFDLDHTLWDFDRNSALAFEQLFKKRKVSLTIQDFLKVYVPVNYRYWELYREDKVTKEDLRHGRLRDSFDLLNLKIPEESINAMAVDYIQFLPLNNHLLEGSLEILDYLRPNYKLHIITNGFEEVQYKKLTASGISEYFTTITTSEEAGCKKPQAQIFETALKKSGGLPGNSLMIGDNYEADVRGALNHGMTSIFFDYYGNSVQAEVRHIKKLKELRDYL